MSEQTRLRATPNLAAILAENERSQSWLARKIGVSVTLMHYIVSGERTMSQQQGEQIADLFGVPLFLVAESTSVDKVDAGVNAA